MSFSAPQEWLNQIGNSIQDWFTGICQSIFNGIAMVVIDGMSIAMVCFSIYYATQIMCTTTDEKFNEYINKILVAMVVYFCARCSVKLIGLG